MKALLFLLPANHSKKSSGNALSAMPVAVFPALVAPQVLWPAATGGEFDAPRLLAALCTLLVGLWRRNVLLALGAGLGLLLVLELLRGL